VSTEQIGSFSSDSSFFFFADFADFAFLLKIFVEFILVFSIYWKNNSFFSAINKTKFKWVSPTWRITTNQFSCKH